jgi:hypothetical protein
LHKITEPFSNRDISFEVIYEECHRVLASGPLAPDPDPDPDRIVPQRPPDPLALALASPVARLGFQPAAALDPRPSSAPPVVLPGRTPPRPSSSPAVLLPGGPPPRLTSSPAVSCSQIPPATHPVLLPGLSPAAPPELPRPAPPRSASATRRHLHGHLVCASHGQCAPGNPSGREAPASPAVCAQSTFAGAHSPEHTRRSSLARGTGLLLEGLDCFYRDWIAFIFCIQGSN